MDSLFSSEDVNIDEDYTDSPNINKLKLSKSWSNPLTLNKGSVKVEDWPILKANSSVENKAPCQIVWISKKKDDESPILNQKAKVKYFNRNTCTTDPSNKSDVYNNVKLVKGMIVDNRRHSSGIIMGLINQFKHQ